MSAHNGSVLPLAHPLMKEAVQSIANEASIVVDCVITDYDNSQYHVVYPGSGETTISVMLNGYQYFQNYISLKEFKVLETEANYSFTIAVTKDQLSLIPQLKMNLLGKVLLQIYEQNTSLLFPTQSNYINTQNSNIIISQFAGEFIFVKGEKDRLTIIFKIVFENGNDDGVAKVFIQELIDARKLVGLQATPQVMYNKEIPLELKSYTSGQSGQSIGNSR
eukprot:NODE_272_length_12196_cov_0.228404.p6 type:complete len:220 gc:universal NODE_272_length_12196_cov_0.228404:11898-11239(-)